MRAKATVGPMASAAASWVELLAGRGARRTSRSSRRAHAHYGAVPGRARPAGRAERSRRRAITALYAHQAEAWEAAAPRRARRSSRPAPRAARRLAFNLPVLDALAREPKSRALYLYPTKALAQDQVRALAALKRPARQAGDLRRRHARRAALADPQVGEPDPDQPGHAPRRRPAAPRPLGRRAREPPLRRRRRGARLPRRLRLARRQRPAPPAPARARLRRRAAVPARLGDDREPRRARARRCSGVDVDRRSATTARRGRADDRALEPAAARRGARPARERARRGVAADGRARRARPAHDLLREEPQGGRADPPLHRRPARATPRRLSPVPRRLHARAAARDRAAARRAASCSASARRTRSSSGSTSACSTASISVGFPGTVASLRQQWGRAGPPRARARRARRERGRARPVLHARAGDAARPARRGGDPRPREPARARRPRPLRPPSRRRSTTPTREILGAEALERAARAPGAEARPPRATSGRAATTRRRRFGLRSASPDVVHRRRRRDRLACSALVERERAYSTVHEGAVYLHLGESYLVAELDLDARTRPRRAVHRRLLHAGEEGDDDRDRGAAAHRAAARARALLRPRRASPSRSSPTSGSRSATRRRSSSSRSTCPRRRSRPRRSGSCPEPGAARGARRRCRSCSARSTPPSTR